MTDQPNSRFHARASAITLACLLMAAGPVYAQEGAVNAPAPVTGSAAPQVEAESPTEQAPAQSATPQAATTPAPQAPVAAPEPDVHEDLLSSRETANPQPVQVPTETPRAQDAATVADDTPAPAAVDETNPVEAAQTAVTDPVPATTTDAPATAEQTTPATSDATEPAATTTPAAVPAQTQDASQPQEDDSLIQSLQRNLAPIFEQDERDPNLPHDLSPIGMFMAADWVVKAVMIGLAFASVVTWTILVVKLLELRFANARVNSTRRRIEAAADLPAAVAATADRNDPASRMVAQAMQEFDRSKPSLHGRTGDEGLKDRVASLLFQIEGQAGRKISQGTGMLATIGSTSPFVGLFGTVWGIMNSFIGISESQTTSLAVVAPGIAEALLATAIGLVAAIPAVVIYNVFARSITGYRMKLSAAGAGVQRLVSRDLDFRTGA